MILTSNKAKEILEQYRGKTQSDMWIEHCLSVGNCGGKIAAELKNKGYNIDVDKCKTLGYMHYIGKYNGEYKGHIMRGYEFLKQQGYDDEYCNICLTHSYLNNDIMCTGGGMPSASMDSFLANFIKEHTYTIEEKIINLCDLMCPQGGNIYTVDKRLIDIIIRRGAHSNTQYHIKETYKLKEYIDSLLGFNLYNLFPEIIENL